jgi:hypothetical protein
MTIYGAGTIKRQRRTKAEGALEIAKVAENSERNFLLELAEIVKPPRSVV